MQDPERRCVKRYVIRVPLAFRSRKSRDMPELFGEIVDVSPCGICFSTASPLDVGTPVDVLLKLPTNVIGRPSPEYIWTGRVVHVRPSRTSEWLSEVGVVFFACDSSEAGKHPRKKRADS
jgi:hypothetical protein